MTFFDSSLNIIALQTILWLLFNFNWNTDFKNLTSYIMAFFIY